MTDRPIEMSPEPTPEEAAAIMVALEALTPRAVVAPPPAPGVANWRFSGRWWNLPIPVRRHRPWY